MTSAALILAMLASAPDPREGNPHYREAQAAFDAGEWERAVVALDRAYQLDARAEYLFMQAQVLRAHDRCDDAIVRYREFIATAPPREDVLSAQAGLALCGATEPAARVPAPVVVAPATPPVAPPVRAAARRPDAWTHALLWPGLAIAGAGAGLLAAGHVRADRAHDAASEPEFERLGRSAPALAQAGIALLSIGGAAVLAGIVRHGVVRRRAKRDRDVPGIALETSAGFRLRW